MRPLTRVPPPSMSIRGRGGSRATFAQGINAWTANMASSPGYPARCIRCTRSGSARRSRPQFRSINWLGDGGDPFVTAMVPRHRNRMFRADRSCITDAGLCALRINARERHDIVAEEEYPAASTAPCPAAARSSMRRGSLNSSRRRAAPSTGIRLWPEVRSISYRSPRRRKRRGNPPS